MVARCILALIIGIGLHGLAHAQSGWTPRKNVELVTGDSGGSQDRVMRLMLKIVQDKKILPVTSVVVNKGGAGGALALVYLNQQAGDGHRILLVSPTFTTNHITGLSATGPADVTPLAGLFSEQLGFYVKGNSPIKSGSDLVRRLKENPQSLSVAIGSNRGNLNHMLLVKVLRTAGMSDAEIQKLKALSFKGAESLPAQLERSSPRVVLMTSRLAHASNIKPAPVCAD